MQWNPDFLVGKNQDVKRNALFYIGKSEDTRRNPHFFIIKSILLPFTKRNFTAEGELVEKPETLMIHEVEKGKEYALLMSSCAGGWRYPIGDMVRFTDMHHSEILITGRTRHFLSLCGEHLSVDTMNRAVQMLADALNVEINEYTVMGTSHERLFAHHWFLSIIREVEAVSVRIKPDSYLQSLNDDYRVERGAALKDIKVTLLPSKVFKNWMKSQGKIGGQHKVPRIIKGSSVASWPACVAAFRAEERIEKG